jgi:hypothetical protein
LNDVANGIYRYTSVVSTSVSNKITVTSTNIGVEPSPTLNALGTGVTGTVNVTTVGSSSQAQIFDLTINSKATLAKSILLTIGSTDSIIVDNKRISNTSIDCNYILVLSPSLNNLKTYATDGYNGVKKKSLQMYIYSLAKTAEDSTRLANSVESYINKNQFTLSTYSTSYQDVRLGEIKSISELSDANVLGYSNGTSNICANGLYFSGFTMV